MGLLSVGRSIPVYEALRAKRYLWILRQAGNRQLCKMRNATSTTPQPARQGWRPRFDGPTSVGAVGLEDRKIRFRSLDKQLVG